MHKMQVEKEVRRLHHISSHFANGLFPAAAMCITLFLLTGQALFEHAALCCCAIGTLGSPFIYGSGLFYWRIRFKKRPGKIFIRKKYVGCALVVVSAVLIILRLAFWNEFVTIGAVKFAYAGVIYVLAGMAGYLGYLGGKFIL
jgi:uncharacterized membrane protein